MLGTHTWHARRRGGQNKVVMRARAIIALTSIDTRYQVDVFVSRETVSPRTFTVQAMPLSSPLLSIKINDQQAIHYSILRKYKKQTR